MTRNRKQFTQKKFFVTREKILTNLFVNFFLTDYFVLKIYSSSYFHISIFCQHSGNKTDLDCFNVLLLDIERGI